MNPVAIDPSQPFAPPAGPNLRFCCPACGSSYFRTEGSGLDGVGICKGTLVGIGDFYDYAPCPARFTWARTAEGDARVLVEDDGEWLP